MRHWTVAIIAAMMLVSTAWALDETGLQYGKDIGSAAKSQLGNSNSVDTRLQKPLTTNTPLKTMDDSQQSGTSAFCGQGEVQNVNKAIQVILDPSGAINISTDTNGDGNFEATSNYTATKICIDGYQVGLPPAAQYYQWTIVSGAVTTTPLGATPLNGCMDPSANTATYIGGSVAQKWADATGKVITNSSLQGNVATYYAGTVKDCAGVDKTPKATKYYDNPYIMNDAAIQQSIVCTMSSTDPACQAYASTRAAQTNVSDEGQSGGPCTIERTVIDSATHTSNTICEANRIYYPSPYTNAAPTCFRSTANPPDRWDYNQQFRFKCDPYGKELHLEAWAWWEGAPCGSGAEKANYPPPYQVTYNMPWGGSSAVDTTIGQLSVNRRGADNITFKDTSSDIACYSTTNPLNIHLLSYACDVGNASCTYNFSVQNSPAPGCQNITYIHVPPPDENITDTCTYYEDPQSSSSSCTLVNEWWYDAIGNKVQTIKDGQSVNNQTQVYSDSAPYTPLPITCKTFANIPPVCKDWWKKDREYSCESKYSKYKANTERAATITDSAWDSETGNFSYQRSSYDKDNTPKCVLEVKYGSGDIANCYTNGLNITCPPKYQFDTVDHLCTADPFCSPYTYDNAANVCKYTPGTPTCNLGYTEYDIASGKCRTAPTCDRGTFSDANDRCELDGNPVCTSPWYTYYDPMATCRIDPPPCPDNYQFSTATNLCEPTAALCPAPGVFTGPPTPKCTSDFDCGADSYDASIRQCYHIAPQTCPPDYNPGAGTCYKPEGDCSTGAWNPTYGKCTSNKEYLCPNGFDLHTGNICISDPTCPLHNSNTVAYASGCITTKTDVCPPQYTLQSGQCQADPKCPGNMGNYILATNQCEYTAPYKYLCDVNNMPYDTNAECVTNCKNIQPCSFPFTGQTGQIDTCTSGTYSICGSGSSINVGPYGTITLAPGTTASGCVPVTWQAHPSVQWTGVGSGISISYNTISNTQIYIGTIGITGLGNITGSAWWDNGQYCADSSIMQIGAGDASHIYSMGQGGAMIHFHSADQNGVYDNMGNIVSSLGAVCPLGAYPCNAGQCTKDGTCTQDPQCPPGYTKDGLKCIATPTCPDNQAVNPSTGKCEKTPTNTCVAPYAETSPGVCQATHICSNSAPLTVVDGVDKCTLNATLDCRNPLIWIASDSLCEMDATCPSNGTINNNRCETPFIPDCPSPYTPDATKTKCLTAPTCGIGSFDATAQKCIQTYLRPAPDCPDGGYMDNENHWCKMNPKICPTGTTYDNINVPHKCWMQYRCPQPGTLDTSTTPHKCAYTPDKCLPHWTYNLSDNSCTKPATCLAGGILNYSKDRCEGTPVCQKTFYPEMDCQYQNPTTKTNLQCLSNDPLPDCAVPLKCPFGGSLNGNICNATPQLKCENPYILTAPDCITAVPCPQSDTGPITIDYAMAKCNTPVGPRCLPNYTKVGAQCQADIPCEAGQYDPATNKCVHTPPTQYQCSLDNNVYNTQLACTSACKPYITGSGSAQFCANQWTCLPLAYTISGSGSTLNIFGTFQLHGFTVTGTTGTINNCDGNWVTIYGNGNQLRVVHGASTWYFSISGATATGSMWIDNGTYCSDNGQGWQSYSVLPNGHSLNAFEYSDSCLCPPCANQYACSCECNDLNPLTFVPTVTGACNAYTQCLDASWTTDGSNCTKTPICPNGGTPDPNTKKCILNPFDGCPIGYTLVAGICMADAICPSPGTLTAPVGCRANPTATCPSIDYTIDNTNTCTASAYCPTGGKPTGGTEQSRRVYQNCSDPTQCESQNTPLKCAVRVTDATYAEGTNVELHDCTHNIATDQYTCQVPPGGIVVKDCDCITETWNSAKTAGDCTKYLRYKVTGTNQTYMVMCKYNSQLSVQLCQTNTCNGQPTGYLCPVANYMTDTVKDDGDICCEPSCSVKKVLSAPEPNSNVHKDYTIRQCVQYGNLAYSYTCPVQQDEEIDQDCGCSDYFALTAGVLSAVVETAKDRVCEP